jgi:hypothetical protein
MADSSATKATPNPGTAPGGLIAPEAMHRVGDNQHVLETDAGTFVIAADGADVPGANVPGANVPGENVPAADAVVVTPGGQRLRSMVHLIDVGHTLDSAGLNLRQIGPENNIIADFGLLKPRPAATPLMPGNGSIVGLGNKLSRYTLFYYK